MIRLIFSFARGEELQYLSHLDLMRLFQRALRRAGLGVVYSRGFNPRPRISLAVPLPVGVTADQEYGEIYLEEDMPPQKFLDRVKDQFPPGLYLTGAGKAEIGERSLSALINAALYEVTGPEGSSGRAQSWQRAAEDLLARPEILVKREQGPKKTVRQLDIRPYIYSLAVNTRPERALVIEMGLQVGSRGGVSPLVVWRQLSAGVGEEKDMELWRWQIHRRGLYIYGEKPIVPLPGGGNFIWIKR